MAFTYRGLKAEYVRHIVTAEEIDAQLLKMLQQTPRMTPVTDRPAQNGDELVLDYAGFCDGEQFQGGTAQYQTLTLGSGAFIPGFEEQLIGANPGDEVTVTVTFPQEYHAPNLAGKEAQFKCKVHEIRIKGEYQMDNTFAQEVAGVETLDEMRALMGQNLQAFTDERGEMDLQDRLLRQAVATLEVELTPEQIEAELDEQMKAMKAQLAQKGLNFQMYLQFMKTTEEKIREDLRPTAEAALRSQAAVDKIVALENLEATEEELTQAMGLIARQNNVSIQQLKEYVDEEFETALVRSVLITKAMELIRKAAEVTEKAE